MYPSDYGYAANHTNWNTLISGYGDLLNDGGKDNWMSDYTRSASWMISPSRLQDQASAIYFDYLMSDLIRESADLLPTLYLKSSVMVSGGDGSDSTPYVLE